MLFRLLPKEWVPVEMAVLNTLVYWFLGPYFRLAEAGLAIEIFKGESAAQGAPEEQASDVIQANVSEAEPSAE